jgi:hypothetical protein
MIAHSLDAAVPKFCGSDFHASVAEDRASDVLGKTRGELEGDLTTDRNPNDHGTPNFQMLEQAVQIIRVILNRVWSGRCVAQAMTAFVVTQARAFELGNHVVPDSQVTAERIDEHDRQVRFQPETVLLKSVVDG